MPNQRDIINELAKAIKMRKPIQFEYHGPGDDLVGFRIGNPHAVYIETNKKDPNNEHILLDLFQVKGVSKSGGLPTWKRYIINFITDISILNEEPIFPPATGYNSYSDRYRRVLVKI